MGIERRVLYGNMIVTTPTAIYAHMLNKTGDIQTASLVAFASERHVLEGYFGEAATPDMLCQWDALAESPLNIRDIPESLKAVIA